MQGGYEPPQSQGGSRPAVITWFRVYACTSLLLIAGFLAFMMFTSLSAMSNSYNPQSSSTLAAMLIIYIALGLISGAFYVVAALVPYKPWGWVYGLVAICFGLSSCLVFAAVPLLIYWLKPETKAAFGRL